MIAARSQQLRHALAAAATPDRMEALATKLWNDALFGDSDDSQFAITKILTYVAGREPPLEPEQGPDNRTVVEAVNILIAAGVPASRLPVLTRLHDTPDDKTTA